MWEERLLNPNRSARESSVNIKLNALKEVVSGKRVVMVDDSIVRGTTSGHIVKMLKDAGATEVHVRISSPPFLFPCYFGTDVPSCDQLIAHDHTVSQICEIDRSGFAWLLRWRETAGIRLRETLVICDAMLLPEITRWSRRPKIFVEVLNRK